MQGIHILRQIVLVIFFAPKNVVFHNARFTIHSMYEWIMVQSDSSSIADTQNKVLVIFVAQATIVGLFAISSPTTKHFAT